MTRFPTLSSPIQIGNMVLKNRMMTTSMSPGHGYVDDEGGPTPRMLHYLQERAAGQTALICQTVAFFYRRPGFGHPLPFAYNDRHLNGLKKMADAVKPAGAFLIGQPWAVHDWKPSDEEEEKPWGPSNVVILKGMTPFTPMKKEHIEIFKEQMVRCARTLQKAGWDGVEVMAGVGGILNRFISPATNNRTDEYGGSLENRCRLTVEVIQAIRKACGPDFAILCRWSPIEYVKGIQEGMDVEQSLAVVPYLERAGIDMHNLAIGWHESSVPLTTKDIPDGHWSWVSEKIKQVAKKPVATGYRETDPFIMEQILKQGKADLIAGLRYNIADPEFVRKVIEDRPEDINMCICCCRCLDDVVSEGKPLEYCGVNPRLGAELDQPFKPVERVKRVMVIGSGPGGLSAAKTAAERGHQVTIYERGPRIGGCLVMSAIFSPMYERLKNYYQTYLKKHPEIKVKLHTKVTPELVDAIKPDAVIVAVGGHPVSLDVPGSKGKHVVQSHDFLEMLNGKPPKKPGLFNKVMWNCGSVFLRFFYTPQLARTFMSLSHWPLGKRIAIIGGGLPGCELGKEMMKHNRELTIFEERKKIGWDVGGSDRFHIRSAFKKSPHVTLNAQTKVTRINETGVFAENQEGHEYFTPADTVTVTLGFEKNMELVDALKSRVKEIYAVGDCIEPARMADATKAGYRAAIHL
ncbi:MULTISPECIES: oxidoreductase [unclassified Sporolactobacillus]|uniref:oxidoreductase n=1 Tax=unclassified Sporolactobacillus TaxID=2628533 RepID=UPI0023683DE4|nr:FAD-dependent oxidoreductase [Sporolactobacillus sp. CQH2019]MDD9146954.1 FAD-dependent oxidoreductase [Sporolactobacillus sp. CQH2019]